MHTKKDTLPIISFSISTIQLLEFINRTFIIHKQNSTEGPQSIAKIQSLTHEVEVQIRISKKHFIPH